MRVFTVHYHPTSRSPDRDVVLVKEGFCWPAFLLSPVWALWRRLWLAAGLIFVTEAVMEVTLTLIGADELSWAAVYLGYRAIVGYWANDWRRRKLARAGYREAGVVAAVDDDAALRRFFDLNPDLLPDSGPISLS